MKKIVIRHGIRTHGEKSTDLLADDMAASGWRIYNPDDLGKAKARNATRKAREFARKMLSHVNDGDHAIGHSQGCLTLLELMRLGVRFDKVIFIAAAVDSDVLFPRNAYTRLVNIHNPKDVALVAGALLPKSGMGAMGRVGYKGESLNVRDLERVSRKGPFNHSRPYFRGEGYKWLLRFCKRQCPM